LTEQVYLLNSKLENFVSIFEEKDFFIEPKDKLNYDYNEDDEEFPYYINYDSDLEDFDEIDEKEYLDEINQKEKFNIKKRTSL